MANSIKNNSYEFDFQFVSATRKTPESFWRTSLLAKGLKKLQSKYKVNYKILFNNRRSLSALYNEAILESKARYIIFIHDDVFIKDDNFFEKIIKEHEVFNILGVAGARCECKVPPSWLFSDVNLKERVFKNRNKFLGGELYHGGFSINTLSVYGAMGVAVDLIDGVFISIDINSFKERKTFFDERFDFHFYDLDFSKMARTNGLNIGISSVKLIHESVGGGYFSDSWVSAYKKFFEKWSDK